MGGKRFGELLDLLTKNLRLRTKKMGRSTFVMLGEGALKDELLLDLAKLFEEGNPKVGIDVRASATKKGFAADLADKVAAELRAEGSVELAGHFPGILRFTDFGYQKYLPRIRALREMAKDAL